MLLGPTGRDGLWPIGIFLYHVDTAAEDVGKGDILFWREKAREILISKGRKWENPPLRIDFIKVQI
jgi:hypothetical protein